MKPIPAVAEGGDPVPQGLVRPAGLLGGQGEVQIAEQQGDPPLPQPVGRDLAVMLEHPAGRQGKRHKRLLLSHSLLFSIPVPTEIPQGGVHFADLSGRDAGRGPGGLPLPLFPGPCGLLHRAGLHAPAAEPAAPDPGRAPVRHGPGRALHRQPGAAVGRRACGSAGGGATAACCWISSSLPTPDRLAFAETLARRLSPRPVYVPESYAAASGAIPLICTAISGGNFVQRLQEAAAGRGGAGSLALDVQRLRMDFTLPAQERRGPPPQRPRNSRTCWTGSPRPCSSPRTCAPGISPMPGTGETHFVLFDDADTLSQKLRTGGQHGLRRRLPDVSGGAGSAAQAVSRRGGHKKCCTFRHSTFPWQINNSASCSCERPQTSCGA